MSPMTLRSLERGGGGVTLGAYIAVMQVLGIEKDLNLLGQADPLGRELQDARLPAQARPPASTRRTILAHGASDLDQAPRQLTESPLAERKRTSEEGSAAQWRRMIGSSPQARLRRLIESLPSEQMRKTLESLTGVQLRKALKALPAEQMREALALLERPSKHIDKTVKPADDAKAWMDNGGFVSSRALADLIDGGAPMPRKKKH